jgi:hypothetical protein
MLRRKARMEKKVMVVEKQLQLQQQQQQQQPPPVLLFGQSNPEPTTPPTPPSPVAKPSQPEISAAASLVQLVHIVMPPHANHMNTMFGGILMEWAEEAARLSVHRHLHTMSRGDNTQKHAALAPGNHWFHLSTVCVSSQAAPILRQRNVVLQLRRRHLLSRICSSR